MAEQFNNAVNLALPWSPVMSQTEVAAALGLSKRQVQKAEASAFKKLCRKLRRWEER